MSAPNPTVSRADIEDFLFYEADLLDEWRLEEWRDLFTEDGRYHVPATDNPLGDPDLDLALISDTKEGVRGRVQRLLSTWAHIENPRSRTRRVIGNVRVAAADDGEILAHCNAIVYRSRVSGTTTYAARLTYRLRRENDGFRIVLKQTVLDHETLRDSGGVLSIII
ncbi:aromatic-ring-hydroxylating dioxygenase subunit beta [Actinomadura sp. NBRC 104412]|uniref:aromatic-ring-hydroxylating dioxygenase subunit beta n=1 Tax=Actinomadura sp. NBRC 104412 TaxID=3032203 RepID=UPI0024A2C91D|nr:aromatic-ring-hydroxylating dioxygenase subunit beta [Actinomadura sp. NBRC 104412]GLZ08139.1 aromatic-ring-hydroxylating dioxygenase subunit beta [Actinomadura sp. NBRC 104412]